MKAVTVAGGSSDDPEIEAETTVLEGEPKATAESEAGAGTESEVRTEPEGDAVAEAEPQGEADAEPEADSESPGEAEPEAEADHKAEPEPGSSKAEAAAGTDPAGEAHSETNAAPEAEADHKSEPGSSESETEAEHAGESEAEAESEHTGEADAELPDEARSETDADAELPDEARSETDADPEAGPKAEAEPERADAADAGLRGEAQPKTGTDPRAASESERLGEADAGLPGEAGSETDAAPDADSKSGVAGEADTELLSEARPEAEADLKAKAEPEAEAEPKAAAEPEHAGEADAELPGEAGSETDAEPEAEPDVTDRSEAEAEAEAGADDRPEADTDGDGGESAAQDQAGAGPEADERRPDGEAGSKASEAGTGGEDASDQTMLIALPKKKPAEPDAPRKAPAWARETEPDPERTSQFVALKDVDLPAPVAPRAQPQPTEAKVAAPAPAAPLPPLDLLAELTNAPAPAETPRRTALRRVKIWTPILLLLAGAGVGAQLLRPLPTPQLVAAEADRTIDGQFSIPWPAKGQGAVRISGSGDVGTFGEQKPVPTASVAKVMTAYVILKGHPLRKTDPGPDITVDSKTVADGNSENESRISGLTAGQKFSQQDMLKMLMIPSGNNVARLLARWDTGADSEAAFVAKMNAAAKDLGMDNTTYTDPSGLDAGTVSTATDQLKLAEAVMKDETFRSIVALPNATIKGLPARLENNNTLLTAQGLSIRGIKTGSSTPAGGTLMWAAYKSIDGKDQLILGTLMDQRVDGPDLNAENSLKLVLANSKTIIEGVRTALASVPVIRKGDVVGHVDDGLGGRTPLVATKDLNVIGVPGQQLKLSLAIGAGAGAGPLPHTAKAGSEVAVLTVGSGEAARSVPVAVKGALAEPSFGTRLTRGR
ncbi:serine hydrolase [Streptomyces sp. NPDC001584]|uniref:serine hydrolase n=1 Tax=Streptomyces sp. NPDC001584 TaxID=3154521 RepID=UPI00331D2BE0